MQIVLFYHSLVSDWNHGNAHFLRGIATELQQRHHEVVIYEPTDSWSRQNLLAERGEAAIAEFQRYYPHLQSVEYDPETLDLEQALGQADLVLVHEWNSPRLVQQIGQYRQHHDHCRVLFHDTHHRSVTDPEAMATYDLTHYDGVLAFGEVIRDLYRGSGWHQQVWTWHEAADIRLFHPPDPLPDKIGDLVWIGNWGDEERTAELYEFLIQPIKDLGLTARVYGVRYPDTALAALEQAGIAYGGWLPNYCVPQVFAQYRVTVHVPRRPYATALPGIPTIRPFEALACGIPLVTAPWHDSEGLFTPGQDFLVAHTGQQMVEQLQTVLNGSAIAQSLTAHGWETIRTRHTCAHRVDQLLQIYQELV